MTTSKCKQCGLVNPLTATTCKRCSAPLDSTGNSDALNADPQIKRAEASEPVLCIMCGTKDDVIFER